MVDVLSKLQGWGKCLNCGDKVHESHRHFIDEKGCYCWNCAFIVGKIKEKEYIKNSAFDFSNNLHAAVDNNGKIHFWTGKNATPPWERSDRKQRSSPEYNAWRKDVYERDNYTCQDCGKRGGTLNAHHLKSFKKYKKLRYKVDNGLTLCELCHRERHRKGGARG
ncbi:MAG: HNH endonuclease [Bacillota bacterium]|nr:HNH endonuclease [Bacillota bacterium]